MQTDKTRRNPLTYVDRQMIEIRLRGKWSLRRIADHLGRDHRVIGREVSRNKSPDGKYRALYAQQEAERKSHITNKRKLDSNDFLFQYVREQLKEGWSPEQIAGRLKEDAPAWLHGSVVSHETIYQYIYESPYGRFLYHYLRRKKRPKRQGRYQRLSHEKTRIPERISIHARPLVIDMRGRVGDWESDSAQFRKQRAGLSVQYERKTMLARIHRVEDKSAKETLEALIGSVESLPEAFWRSITFDNGLEGAEHGRIRDAYGIATFFCDPYKSWQKGGVENLIGLVRQYLPKHVRIDTLTAKEVHDIQERLNNRPRKKLRYRTPNEMLAGYKKNLTLSLMGGA